MNAELIEAQVIGWIIWCDGLQPLWDTDGPKVFTDFAEAARRRGMLDVVSPITQARYEELARRFDGGRGLGHN